jgi:hypothetical protein
VMHFQQTKACEEYTLSCIQINPSKSKDSYLKNQ